jgi:hypothetical protein
VSPVFARIGRAQRKDDDGDWGLDLDSHADMAVLGSNCFVFEETNRTINVYSYDPKMGSHERKVVSGVFAYDDPTTGKVTLLIVHQGLHVPHLTYSLIPPFQMRENDIIVNECPKFQCIKPTEDDHAIIVDGSNGNLHIPLSLRGTTSYIDVRRPTQAEIDNSDLDRIELTYSTPDWEPGVRRYSVLEQQLQEDHTILSKIGGRKPAISIRRLDSRLDVVERGFISTKRHNHHQ